MTSKAGGQKENDFIFGFHYERDHQCEIAGCGGGGTLMHGWNHIHPLPFYTCLTHGRMIDLGRPRVSRESAHLIKNKPILPKDHF